HHAVRGRGRAALDRRSGARAGPGSRQQRHRRDDARRRKHGGGDAAPAGPPRHSLPGDAHRRPPARRAHLSPHAQGHPLHADGRRLHGRSGGRGRMNERSYGLSDEPAGRDFSRWLLDSLRHLAVAWRPHLGWAALALCMMVAVLPATLVWENGWLRGGPLMARLYMAGPLAVLSVWVVGGWRRPATWGRRVVRLAVQGGALLLLSAFLLSQLL